MMRLMQLEFAAMWRERYVLWLAVVYLAMSAVAVASGWAQQQSRQAQIELGRQEEQGRYGRLRADLADYAEGRKSAIGFLDPSRAGAVGKSSGARVVHLPLTPMGVLIAGDAALFPAFYRVSTEGRDSVLAREELANPALLAAGHFDYAFVLVVIFPLFLIALTYDVLAADRDSGVLALALSTGIALFTLLAIKLVPRAVIACGCALVVLLAAPGVQAGMAAAFILLYACFWLSVVAMANWTSASAGVNLIALLCAWLLLTLLIPRTVELGAEYVHPAPSRVQLLESVRVASQEAMSQGSLLLAEFLDDHPELQREGIDPSDFLTRSAAVQAVVDRLVRPTVDEYQRQLTRQRELLRAASIASPALLLMRGLRQAAGTGEARQAHFEQQLSAFHERWVAYFLPLTLERKRLTPADLEWLPQFLYVEQSTTQTAQQIKPEAMGLLGWTGVTAAIAALLYRRRTAMAS